MDILAAVENFLAKKGTLYEPDFETGDLSFGQVIEKNPVRMKIYMGEGNLLCFRSLLPFALNAKKANELFVAVNAVNSYIKFGKFVINGHGVYFETSRPCNASKLKDKDIAYFLTASKQTTKNYLLPLAGINDGKIKLKDFLDTLV